MTKPEFIAEVAKVAETTKIDAEKVINAMLETVQETLAKGDSIQFVGFGTFEVKERAARFHEYKSSIY
jgi:DNA-binding protein HU-beta